MENFGELFFLHYIGFKYLYVEVFNYLRKEGWIKMTEWDYIEMPTSLMQTIEQKRSELVSFAIKYGLSSEKTIKSSQELDKLLNTLEKSKSFH